ncbi:RidA family protein [Paenibacillus sp. NPDC057967]|uniref:RidA family protein n=1 Tax=Paenibacillus sp. NPDC057967 TaxID=3346293 RepID=UPI0036DCBBC6
MSDATPMDRLQSLGIVLPEASKPAARYANYVLSGSLLFISGKGPSGKPKGKLGIDYTTEEGCRYAWLAGLEVLAVLMEALGSLNKVKRVVKIQGFVNAGPDFEEHHKVLNGCSDLMLDIFGDRGLHARSVHGASSLRNNLPVIIDSVFEIELD